jgi:hypothetical protein
MTLVISFPPCMPLNSTDQQLPPYACTPNCCATPNSLNTTGAILCYAYYWYNFMPLARGTAAVGYTTMLGLFWAAGMPITQPIPRDYQVR